MYNFRTYKYTIISERKQLLYRFSIVPSLLIAATLLFITGCNLGIDGQLVSTISEFEQAVEAIQPGETIVMANGVWEDVELQFKGNGTSEKPITLTAQTPGEVIISGQSNLAFSGEHLVISDLVFKNGYTPTSEVISFRTSKTELANNSRVTNIVIDNFSNPERFDSDTWVAMYGKNNRFDHNSLMGKGNSGVTLTVILDTEESRENNHIIEYNYFGPRQNLGSNGGETLRIGTSHYSLTDSRSVVRKNYFDRTSGELEIVSSKSGRNELRENVFFESQGTLTLRHGQHAVVENNYFLGNRVPNTGGIRIINEYQTVRNNYLYGLTGHRFKGALVIMNGVPNSPINRYNQVVDSYMDRNIVVQSDHIQLAAGSDAERSAVPIGSTMKSNIFMSKTNLTPFTIYDDVSGIEFAGNIMNEEANAPFEEGFKKVPFNIEKNEFGLWAPDQELIDEIGFGEVRLPVTKEETGASYYPKTISRALFASGQVIAVEPGTNTIIEALENSNAGDVLELENGQEYLMTKYAYIHHPVTIRTKDGEKASIFSGKQSFFRIENGGALKLSNVIIDGRDSPDLAGNNVVSTSKYSMTKNYALIVEDSEVKDLDKNHSFDFLKVYKHTFADSINIINTKMTNITGSVMNLDQETEDLGIYNVENVNIINSEFTDVQGAVANIYRGGTDESTFGPIVVIDDVKISDSGKGSRNKAVASLKFHGVQRLNISASEINNSAPIELYLTNGEPITEIEDLLLVNTPSIKSNNNRYKISNIKSVSN